jgi:cytoskeleton protein RodZ
VVSLKLVPLCEGGFLAGEILKQRREELGLDLREISETLRIKYAYLKALEDGDIEQLPAEVYVKGYIHEYAKVLHVDPDPIITAYTQQISPPSTSQSKPSNEDSTQLKKNKTGYLLIPALLIAAALLITTLQFPSSRKGAEAPVPVPPAQKEIAPPVTENIPPQPRSVSPQQISGHSLRVHAQDTTWLQVMIDKEDQKEMLMKPGDSVEWHAENCFSLKIGNAGGVRLLFDGKEIANLGEAGQVITVTLPQDGT